jgi:mono/diheme cytochrome c family protein
MELFNARVVGSNPGCVTCHSLNEGVTLVGPTLYGVGTVAADRVPGLSASEYLKQSIVEPDAFTVPGFREGQMVGRWADFLTPEQIDSLVEFLLGL